MLPNCALEPSSRRRGRNSRRVHDRLTFCVVFLPLLTLIAPGCGGNPSGPSAGTSAGTAMFDGQTLQFGSGSSAFPRPPNPAWPGGLWISTSTTAADRRSSAFRYTLATPPRVATKWAANCRSRRACNLRPKKRGEPARTSLAAAVPSPSRVRLPQESQDRLPSPSCSAGLASPRTSRARSTLKSPVWMSAVKGSADERRAGRGRADHRVRRSRLKPKVRRITMGRCE